MFKHKFLLLLIALNTLSAGCSEATNTKLAVYPVGGQLLVGGQPAEGAVVSFHPAQSDPTISLATAIVIDNGQFLPAQSEGAAGLPEGTYALTVVWPDANGEDRFKGNYADPSRPIAQLTVTSGVNMIPLINLP